MTWLIWCFGTMAALVDVPSMCNYSERLLYSDTYQWGPSSNERPEKVDLSRSGRMRFSGRQNAIPQPPTSVGP